MLKILRLFSSRFPECLPVRFAYLGVPGFVLKGEPVWLDCGYDLEGNELYSVKWYKDNVEFYRFLPSDDPSAQMYKLDGVFLDVSIIYFVRTIYRFQTGCIVLICLVLEVNFKVSSTRVVLFY